METIPLSCGKCGAPLEAPAGTDHLTCGYCSSRLVVRRSGGAIFTEVLAEIREKTERMSENLEVIRLQNDLERLDREWQMGRERYLVVDKHGRSHLPSRGASLLVGLVVAGFGVFWTVTAAGMGAPGFFPLFGVLFVGMAVWMAFAGAAKAAAYERDCAAYEGRRGRLLAEIREREGMGNERAADERDRSLV